MVLKGVRHVLGRHLARRRGGPGLKNTLIQCTWAAARKNGSNLQVQFRRLRSRPATKKDDRRPRRLDPHRCLSYAQAWHPLPRSRPEHFDGRAKTVQTGRLITHLHKLGYAVRITL